MSKESDMRQAGHFRSVCFVVAVSLVVIVAGSGCGDNNDDPVVDMDGGDVPIDAGLVDAGSDAGDDGGVGDVGTDTRDDAAGDVSLSIVPAVQDFGSTVIGDTGSAADFTVVNTGVSESGDLAVSLNGADRAEFEVTSDGCTTFTLAPNGTCVITARFSPNTTGEKSATLTVDSGGVEASAVLTGEAIADDIAPVLQPGSANFGSVAVGDTTMPISFVLENTGSAASGVVTTNGLRGADAMEFNVVDDSCDGRTIAPGADCAISVTFSPTSVGAKAASLGVAVEGGGTTSVSLAGTGTVFGGLTITPGSHDFGNTSGTSAPFTFTLTNTGSAGTGVISLGLGGANFSQFSLVANTCPAALAAGASCEVQVAFAPTTLGPQTATLDVSATPGGTAIANLGGTGVLPTSLAINPGAHDFGAISVNNASAAFVFTVTNTGTQPPGGLSVGLSGASSEFAIAADTCSGTSLAPSGACDIAVAFTPMTPGTHTAKLEVSEMNAGMVSATLEGFGQ